MADYIRGRNSGSSTSGQAALDARLDALENLEPTETLVLRQDVTGGASGLFTSASEAMSTNANSLDPSSEIKFSIMDQLEQYRRADGTFHFILRYFDTNTGDNVEAEFTQTSNPLDNPGAPQGFTLISTTHPDPTFSGIGYQNGGSAYFDGQNGGIWWWSIATNALYTGGTIPAVNAGLVAAKVAELYIVFESQSEIFTLRDKVAYEVPTGTIETTTLSNFDGTPSISNVTIGSSQTFYTFQQILFDLNELPVGAAIKQVNIHDYRAGNFTGFLQFEYDGQTTNGIGPADHPNGFSVAPRNYIFPTAVPITAAAPLRINGNANGPFANTQNTVDQGAGNGSPWIASITPGQATASGGADDGATSVLDGFNGEIVIEHPSTVIRTVYTYTDGTVDRLFYYNESGDRVEIDSLPADWLPYVAPNAQVSHDAVTLAADSDPALEIDGQELKLTLPVDDVCFTVLQATNTNTPAGEQVYEWSATVNGVWTNYFKITDDPAATDALTEILLPSDGTPKTHYIIGAAQDGSGVFWAGGFTTAQRVDLRWDGSAVVATATQTKFLDDATITSYIGRSYNDITTVAAVGYAVHSGNFLTQKSAGYDDTALTSRIDALEAIHKNVAIFDVNPVEAGDTTVVFHWNNTNSANDITGDEFKVTDDPASATALTQVTIQDGETKRLYLIGSIAAPNVGGLVLDVLNTNGVLSYTHVAQRFTDNVDYIAASYNDMDESNPNIGTFSAAEGERVFTLRDVLEHQGSYVMDASLVTWDQTGATLLFNTPQVTNGDSSIYDGTITQNGSLRTFRFKLEHDRDQVTVYDFSALVPAGAKIVSAHYPLTDNVAHECPTEVAFTRASDTAISFNRADSIEDVCNYWVELTFEYP